MFIAFGPVMRPIFGILGSELIPVGFGVDMLVEDLLPGFQQTSVYDLAVGSNLTGIWVGYCG